MQASPARQVCRLLTSTWCARAVFLVIRPTSGPLQGPAQEVCAAVARQQSASQSSGAVAGSQAPGAVLHSCPGQHSFSGGQQSHQAECAVDRHPRRSGAVSRAQCQQRCLCTVSPGLSVHVCQQQTPTRCMPFRVCRALRYCDLTIAEVEPLCRRDHCFWTCEHAPRCCSQQDCHDGCWLCDSSAGWMRPPETAAGSSYAGRFCKPGQQTCPVFRGHSAAAHPVGMVYIAVQAEVSKQPTLNSQCDDCIYKALSRFLGALSHTVVISYGRSTQGCAGLLQAQPPRRFGQCG